jgi:PAS domain S-box-containing protein
MSMIDFVNKLFDSTGFMPRRYCGTWTSTEIALHNVSDAVIWLAYMAIPIVLIHFVNKKRGALPYPKMFWMVGAFIILCGFTHLMDIVMFYYPLYRLAGILKGMTAVVSLITAAMLVPLIPQALAMRTPVELEREISERIRTEEERDRYFQMTLDLLCVAGTDGFFRRVNPAFGTVLNWTSEELLAKSFFEIIHIDDQPATLEQVRRLASGIPILDFEIRCLCKNGAYRWICWSGSPADGTGKFYACGRDVTERKRTSAELEVVHRQLLESSHKAGMAEVATNVLHNVGNVLNSVNVSSTLVAETVRKSKSSGLGRAVALLQEHETDLATYFTTDPRGKQLPAYLAQLADHLQAEQKVIVQELHSLEGNIEHIKEIVTLQQGYAKASCVKEIVKVVELVEDSLRMNSDTSSRGEVEIVREFEIGPPVKLEKHKILQILVNLIRNAKQACHESGQLTLRIIQTAARIAISVTDNGVGIPAENLTRIFSHGFTTRKSGHGFGLHSGALAAREMGGALKVHSDGIGQGATFTLELPLSVEEQPYE